MMTYKQLIQITRIFQIKGDAKNNWIFHLQHSAACTPTTKRPWLKKGYNPFLLRRSDQQSHSLNFNMTQLMKLNHTIAPSQIIILLMQFQVNLNLQQFTDQTFPTKRSTFRIPQPARARTGLHKHEIRTSGRWRASESSKQKPAMNSDDQKRPKLRAIDQITKERQHKLDILLSRSSARLDLMRNKYNSLSSIQSGRFCKYSKIRTLTEKESKSAQFHFTNGQGLGRRVVFKKNDQLKNRALTNNSQQDLFCQQITVVAKKCSKQIKRSLPGKHFRYSTDFKKSLIYQEEPNKIPKSRRYLNKSIGNLDFKHYEPWVAKGQYQQSNITNIYDNFN